MTQKCNEHDGRIQLFVTDLDKTALGGYEPYNRIPDPYSAFLDELNSRGVLWATCTTWHPVTQNQIWDRSALQSRPVRMIGRSGLCCGRYEGGRLVLDAQWDADLLTLHATYAKQHLPQIRQAILGCEAVKLAGEYFDYIIEVEFSDSSLAAQQLLGQEAIKQYATVQFLPGDGSAHIVPAHMSKGPALRRVQTELGIAPEHTAVAGDGVNDLSMFDSALAGFQLAPANADPKVIEHVRANGGTIGTAPFSDGIIEAALKAFAT